MRQPGPSRLIHRRIQPCRWRIPCLLARRPKNHRDLVELQRGRPCCAAWESVACIASVASAFSRGRWPRFSSVAGAAICRGRALSYQAEISRTSPTAILMVMDQSASMNHRLNSGQSKAAFLADVLNKTLYTIITNCSKSDGVRDYFHVGVVAYGGGKDAGNGFQGAL